MILAVVDARAACPKLAANLLSPILGEPMIWRQIERIRQARTVSKLEVLVGDRAADDTLAGYLLGRGVAVRRDGQSDDPALWSATHVARIPADRPLIDPRQIDEAVAFALRTASPVVDAGEALQIVAASAAPNAPSARLPQRHPDWKVQTPEDFAFVRSVFQALHPQDPGFGAEDVIELIEGRPGLAAA